MLPGNKRSKGWRVSVCRLEAKVQSAAFYFKTRTRGSDFFWLKHKNPSPPSQLEGLGASPSPTVVDQRNKRICSAFCPKRHGTGGVRTFRGAACCDKDSTQFVLWPKMAQELSPQKEWGQWQKNKKKCHFGHNFNTRLIVFSWAHLLSGL